MNLELDNTEIAALIELRCDTNERDRYLRSPRLWPYKAILLKLGVGTSRPYPAPKPPIARRLIGKPPRP